jgi:hypothetical protein
MIFRWLIYAILFYIIWKFLKVLMRYLSSSQTGNPDIKNRKESPSKYRNIEDAKYTDIKDEDNDKENKH